MGKAAAALISYGYSKSSINPKSNNRINITSPLSATASVGNLANKISSAIRTGSNKASSVKAMKSPSKLPTLINPSTPRATKTYKPVGNSLGGVSSLAKNLINDPQHTVEILAAKKAGVPTFSNGMPNISSPSDAQRFKNAKEDLIKNENENSININKKYVVNQQEKNKSYSGNCCKTSCYMLARQVNILKPKFNYI